MKAPFFPFEKGLFYQPFRLFMDSFALFCAWMIVFNSPPYKQKNITRGCDRYIESFVCEIDRSQSRHMFCWCGSGSGSPSRTHDYLYSPYQISPTITCRTIYPVTKSATYVPSMSIGRVYVQPGANIFVTRSRVPRRFPDGKILGTPLSMCY